MTELFFLVGPAGEVQGKGTQRGEYKDGGPNRLGAVDKLAE